MGRKGEPDMSQFANDSSSLIRRRTFLQAGGLSTLSLPHLFASGSAAEGGSAAPVASTAVPGAAAPARPLQPWMFVIYPLEQWLADYQRTFDAWHEGGVRGIVIGLLVFYKEEPL